LLRERRGLTAIRRAPPDRGVQRVPRPAETHRIGKRVQEDEGMVISFGGWRRRGPAQGVWLALLGALVLACTNPPPGDGGAPPPDPGDGRPGDAAIPAPGSTPPAPWSAAPLSAAQTPPVFIEQW